MSVYDGKIVELLAIEKNYEKSYIHIKLFVEKEVELFWEIDSDTAENLRKIAKFDGNHKNRLSLHTSSNTTKKHFISVMTKTYRDKSNGISFACSSEYKNDLDTIKNTQSINELIKLPFLSMKIPTINEIKIEQTIEQNEGKISKRYNLPFKWVNVAMISVILFILFGYSNSTFSNNNTINSPTIAKAAVERTKSKVENKKNVVKLDTNLKKENSFHPALPYIKLNDFLTYSLPEGYVSLTFDDGPSQYTEKIVDLLKKYNVGGTFFFIGNNVKKYPDFVRYVSSNGYSIGSHSMTHVRMSGLSYKKQADELTQSTKSIENITNEKVVLFRPPYEALNEQTKDVIHHYQDKLILWNKDTEDWKTRNPDKIFNYVCHTEASGSIILLHESQAVINALPKIIEYLEDRDLNIVSLQ
jgi:peptidoglycan-N-acetylglucosamine deacetylase